MERRSIEFNSNPEANLRFLAERFPSTSQVAIVQDAEQKLEFALEIWQAGNRDIAAALLVDTRALLYDFADVMTRD